ncbi:MAG: HAD family hydrolase [Tissierellia bacterium]|nr:HAD family hydrolase [Tissierellia bacterium]
MKKLIIFDIDGTTLDTMETITFHINKALEKYGIEPVDTSYTSSILGYSSVYLMEKVLEYRGVEYDQDKFKEILDTYHNSYQSQVTHLTKPYEGIIQALKDLREMGYILVALSNKPEHTLSVLFEEMDLYKYFDFVRGQVDEDPRKPDPYMVNLILDKYSVDKEDAILIGDTEVDYETARNSQMDFIAVSWGFRSKKQLEELNPSHIVDDVKEMMALIKEGLQ